MRPFLILLLAALASLSRAQVSVSGIYPHLAMFNDEGECGTGAVVPFADRLWVVTYAPHMPKGSSDKLYEITPDLQQIIRPESIGGTPANRMIHRESNQLFIGPYAIDAERHVRVIPYEKMFGRPTGNARHLSDPANKIYYATMEEGVYEVNVNSLAVTQLWADEADKTGRHADLPGYHGKGFYMGQDRLIYANNGDHAPEAKKNPAVPSGVLATWDGRASAWTTVRRNQFTEVTGPGGILGSSDPENDPVWSIGWDHRSLILMVLDHGTWHTYRLPKSSHSYDGAHGWNTEWPRIREIGDDDTLLMTMHGMFWKFPKTFRPGHTQGIAPRSSYLKVIGDFCRWGDRVVFGCDDTAKNEFLNQRKAKGKIAAPQSQSNLWFVPPDRLDHLGPALGRGAVWLRDDVTPATPSDAFLFSGFDRRALHLHHEGDSAARIRLEIDLHGTDEWTTLQQVELPARGYQWIDLTEAPAAAWVRLVCEDALTSATAWFHFSNRDERPDPPAPLFAGIATPSDTALTGGIIRARGGNKRTLHFTAIAPAVNDSTRGGTRGGTRDVGLYELSADLQLTPVDDDAAARFQKTQAAIPVGVLQADAASVLFIDDQGQRWRLPRGDAALDRAHPLGPQRIDREVATERDLFNAYGTFFELPADNAGGFSKLRPVTTHNLCIHDYCSYRGLFVVSGIANDSPPANEHIIRSSDGQTALWVGAVDDIWQMGKPRGHGGPWLATTVKANEASDPYLMTGYDRKTLTLESDQPTTVSLQIDIDGTGLWQTYRRIELTAGTPVKHEFPAAFQAYWLRTLSSADATVTVQLDYR